VNRFFALRRVCGALLVASPLAVVLACSQPASHPPIIGDCSGANCVVGGGAAGSSSSDDGSTTTSDDGSTTDDSGDADDSDASGD
jgi:hypothetical protein